MRESFPFTYTGSLASVIPYHSQQRRELFFYLVYVSAQGLFYIRVNPESGIIIPNSLI